MDSVERFPIQRITKEDREDREDVVTRELPLTIILNNEELTTLLCSPKDLKYLAVGFLASEGVIKDRDEIRKIVVDERKGVVRVETVGDKKFAPDVLFKRLITSGCGRGVSFYSAADVQGQPKIASETAISSVDVFALVKEFQHRSQMYKMTGGVHSAALCNTESIMLFNEDIGRHNAIDKIFGECVLNGISVDGRIIVTSGRVSSEILLKVVKRSIPILISRSAPTSMGVRLADDLGVTLIGFVRGERMNVYTGGWRVTTSGK